MSAACLWNQGHQTVPVTVTRTEGADIPAGHYEVLAIPTSLYHFAPITELETQGPADEVETPRGLITNAPEVEHLKHSKETS